jgi:hypothetical protein
MSLVLKVNRKMSGSISLTKIWKLVMMKIIADLEKAHIMRRMTVMMRT